LKKDFTMHKQFKLSEQEVRNAIACYLYDEGLLDLEEGTMEYEIDSETNEFIVNIYKQKELM